MKPVKTLHSRHQHGNKHPGVYKTKDINPIPRAGFKVSFYLSGEYITKLQERYLEDLPTTHSKLAKKLVIELLDNIPPQEL
jgi:hypothetical protein